MKLFKEFKPRIMEADTKPLLEMKIRNNWKSSGWKISNTGSGLYTGDKRIMVNYQKFRSKRGVRNAHWIAYVYMFDEEFLYFVKDGVVVATHYICADMGQGAGFIADSSFEVK